MTPRPTADAGVPRVASVPAGPPAPPRLDSRDLFGGAVEIEILHKSLVYRLRQTAMGKLILTK